MMLRNASRHGRVVQDTSRDEGAKTKKRRQLQADGAIARSGGDATPLGGVESDDRGNGHHGGAYGTIGKTSGSRIQCKAFDRSQRASGAAA